MNVHDSERLAGLLEAAGYRRAPDGDDADVVVFNTCAVRENADNKLYGNISHLAPRKRSNPDMQIAVGGCLAQKDKDDVLRKAPWVDVVFGTHNIGSLPTLLERARHNRVAQVEIAEALQEFPSALPAARESAYAAWVSISVGCNNSCTFCIVPSLRGKEVDRSPNDILTEVRSLVDDGVLEVTLLGQNVNAYGVSFADPRIPRNRGAFAELLTECGRIEGLERVRFTSPHPAEFTDDVIEAMAQTPNVCPALHMPLQSGSDRMLRAMRRSYRAERYLGIIDRVRAAMPHAAITTDLIVGFPGETEEDFTATLDVVRQARFANAFTFQYSKRPGTPAAELDGQLPKAVVQERYERLIALQDQIALEENRNQIGRTVELLVATGEGRKDSSTARMSGRARDGRLVHFTPGEQQVRAGDVITTTITRAAPHHLIADGAVISHRRTRAGDAAGQRPSGVGLGMPDDRATRGGARAHGVHADEQNDPNRGEFDAFRDDIEAAERRIAREIEPGARAVVVAILVFVLIGSFVLPHTGDVRGWDVLFSTRGAGKAAIALPSRVFSWLALVFGVGFSMLALLTRRWALAWVALAGSAVASAAGLLAVWSRQTVASGHPGPGIGLVVAWIAIILLTFHWARVVWSRTIVQLAAEEQRRQAAAHLQARTLLETLDDPDRAEPPKPNGKAQPPG